MLELKSNKKEMTYDATIVKHSISPIGNEIITWELTMPKWLVGEFNTHKVEIERNSASSRAVPTTTVLNMVSDQPCIPMWRYNQSGMTAAESLTPEDELYATEVWLEIRDAVIESVKKLQKLPSGRSVSKGIANRPLEFVMWTKIVCTMTIGGGIGFNNFMGLRDTVFAQPEFGNIAHQMHEGYHNSEPLIRLWHLPYVDEKDSYQEQLETLPHEMLDLALQSSARCGRVTHYRQGIEYTFEEDIARGKSFADNGHFSPLRHASIATLGNTWHGNFFGWQQISKLLMIQDYIKQCCNRLKHGREG